MKNQLNTDNAHYLTFIYEELHITLLGGIRIDTLDRLRVTIKIEFNTISIRHNLDLYNDSQTEKLIRKCSERFELGTVYLNKVIGELINQLEHYRMEELKKQAAPTKKRTLTTEEHATAIAFLQASDLLQRTNEMIGNSGMIGEEQNRLLMYLIFTSRKREHPLHIISLASSGAGKSYLQEKVSELIPEEDKIEMTILSESALYYFGQEELKHKLILIEDLDGAENALYPLRELQSKRKITKTIVTTDNKGNTKTAHLTVEGPVSVAGCTTQESIYEDNANRSFLIYLDESTAQDEKIMAYQRAQSAGTINSQTERAAKELLKNVQRALQPITIKNRYAELLQLPKEVFKPRRSNAHYLQFIEAITFYKQYQRTQSVDINTGELYIETTIEDIQEANTLIKEILLRKSDELNTACRRYFEYLKAYLKSENKTQFTTKEVREALKTKHGNQKRYMLQLLDNNYVKKEAQKNRSYIYEIVSYEEYETLQNNITNILDSTLHQLIQISHQPLIVHSSNTVHPPNEPLKPSPTKRKKANNAEVQ
jgi:hypothetical protein